MTSPREVLEKYFGRPLSMEWDGEEGFSNKESITIALSDLAEIVSVQLKENTVKEIIDLMRSGDLAGSFSEGCVCPKCEKYGKKIEKIINRLLVTDIAKLFTDKEV